MLMLCQDMSIQQQSAAHMCVRVRTGAFQYSAKQGIRTVRVVRAYHHAQQGGGHPQQLRERSS